MKVRNGLVLLVVAATLVATAIAASPASAAGGRLTITKTASGLYNVTVCGNVSNAYPGGAYTEIRLWGSDTFYDDFLFGPYVTTAIDYGAYPCPEGGYGNIHASFLVSGSTLNEDWGTDEVYAGVRARNNRNGSQQTFTTNTISRSF